MTELEITRNSHLVDPHLHVWGWEIPVYLFLGGLTAGIMVFSALLLKRGNVETQSKGLRQLPFVAPIIISIGMAILFLDLEYKTHVYRFYFAFKPTSPMSWGAWVLLGIYPVSIGLGLAYMTRREVGLLKFFPPLRDLANFATKYRNTLLYANVVLGIALGIYTGILLGALGTARPLWNSALLGPLFLISGLSTGAALMMLFPLAHKEHDTLRRWDLLAIGAEMALIFLFVLTQFTGGGQAGREAIELIAGGPYTAAFWALVITAGLVVPFIMESIEGIGKLRPTRLAPILLLAGGLALRWIIVLAGQA